MPDPHDLEQDPLPLDDNRSAERLIDDLVTSGRYSQAELADILDRSPSLISKIRHGKKPGANLLGALRELDERDAVTQTPTRRRRKDGTVAKVRGKRGQGSVVPRIPEEPLTPTEVRRRHRPTRAPHQERDVQAQGRDLRDEPDTTDVAQAPPPVEHPAQPRLEKPRPPARNRLHFDVTTLPNGQRAALARWNPRNAGDRDRVADALADLVRHAAARGDRFQAVVQYEFDGQKYPVELGRKGGYNAGNILSALAKLEDDGGNFIDWLHTQCLDRPAPRTAVPGGSPTAEAVARGRMVEVKFDTW